MQYILMIRVMIWIDGDNLLGQLIISLYQTRHAGLGERQPAIPDREDRGDGHGGRVLPAHGHPLPRLQANPTKSYGRNSAFQVCIILFKQAEGSLKNLASIGSLKT